MTAWILLAAIVTLTKHDVNARPLWLMLVYAAVFIGIMLLLGRVLQAWSKRIETRKLPMESMLIFVVLALVAGAAGEWIGIHALVGAFIAGLVTPRQFRPQLIDKLEALTLLVFMPIFFALTGIRTNLIFQLGGSAYFDLLLILLVAVASKWGGTTIGARLKGMPLREACQLGLMMNTRGLVELIVLNVGLDSGILSPPLFSMMVCMALVTTFMATPLMDWFAGKRMEAAAA
jgi:Kef-type K+ transport system membrane component KefB